MRALAKEATRQRLEKEGKTQEAPKSVSSSSDTPMYLPRNLQLLNRNEPANSNPEIP